MKGKRSPKKVYEVFMVYLGPGDHKKLQDLAKAEERSMSFKVRKWIRTEYEALPK
jgi:hypothetical protein